jgi:hypothetical protein
MAQIIEVSFKGNRRAYYAADAEDLQLNDYVIVEADRGEDLGRDGGGSGGRAQMLGLFNRLCRAGTGATGAAPRETG